MTDADDMTELLHQHAHTLTLQWNVINEQARAIAFALLGCAATDPRHRTDEMRHFVAANIPKCNDSLPDHLKDLGFQVHTRGLSSKLVYRRKDGRQLQEIPLRDKEGRYVDYSVDDLEVDVFNHLYVKFFFRRQSTIEKGRATRISKRPRE